MEQKLRELTVAELDHVSGGAITKTNGGGNTPNGNASTSDGSSSLDLAPRRL
jgi:hypothetical protein